MKAPVLVLLLLLAARLASAAPGPPRYAIVDLGTLAGNDSRGVALNDAGWVAGTSRVDVFTSRAFLWLPAPALGMEAGMHDLGTLGGNSSFGSAIDSAGRVAGTSFLPGEKDARAFRWETGTMTDLGTIEPWPSSTGEGINDLGEVVGKASALGCVPSLWLPAAHYGYPAGVHELPMPAGWSEGEALDINDHGQVVGYLAWAACDGLIARHPYLWLPEPAFGLPAGPHDLFPDAPTEDFYSHVLAINDVGEMVGWRAVGFVTGPREPLIWRRGVAEPLPLPPGIDTATATGLDDRGRVVGYTGIIDIFGRALLWQDGEVHDLNDLIPPGSGWELKVANAINESDQIVGTGLLDGERRAFLLTPLAGTLEIPVLGAAGTILLVLLLAGAGAALLARAR